MTRYLATIWACILLVSATVGFSLAAVAASAHAQPEQDVRMAGSLEGLEQVTTDFEASFTPANEQAARAAETTMRPLLDAALKELGVPAVPFDPQCLTRNPATCGGLTIRVMRMDSDNGQAMYNMVLECSRLLLKPGDPHARIYAVVFPRAQMRMGPASGMGPLMAKDLQQLLQQFADAWSTRNSAR